MYAIQGKSDKGTARKLLARQRLLGQAPSYGGGASTAQVVSKRAYIAVRATWAATLLLFPDRVLSVVDGRTDSHDVVVARVLGVRHGIQAIAETTAVLQRREGVAIDLLHATSMLLFAGLDSKRRKAASADFVVATTFALWGLSLRSS